MEYGNELAGATGIEAHLDPEVYAEGFEQLRNLVMDIWAGEEDRPLLVGPDSGFNKGWMDAFLTKATPDVVTTHMYSLGPGVDYQAAQVKATDPTSLNKIAHGAFTANASVRGGVGGEGRKLWVGEAGGAYNSGAPNVTDGFVSAFWYLDNMATLASHGFGSFCRQTLLGGNYELLDHNSLEPNPDYYAALLWRQLMGSGVIGVEPASSVPGLPADEHLRSYGSCSRQYGNPTDPTSKGGLTLLFLNLRNDTTQHVDLTLASGEMLSAMRREEYHVAAYGSPDLDPVHLMRR